MYLECDSCARVCSEHITKEPYKSDIMIIGGSPSAFEIISGELFSDVANKTLYRELYEVGIDMTFTYATKAIKCNMNNVAPKKKDIKQCRKILHAEVAEVNPKYILTLGSLALETLIGKGNVSKNHGKVIDFNGAKVIATYSPSVFVKQPHYAIEFRADIEYFSRITGGLKIKEPDDFKFKIIESYEQLLKMRDYIGKKKVIAYDIETTGVDEYDKDSKLFMIGIATNKWTFIVPLETPHYNPETENYYDVLKPLLEKSELQKTAQYAKFDNRWLRLRGINPYIDFDTFLAAYTLNVNTPHGLKWLAKTYCGAGDYGDGVEFKKELTKEEFDAMAKYCALDCYYTLRLRKILGEMLRSDKGLNRVFKHIIMPGERTLQRIEERGAYVNPDSLERVTKEYTKEKDNLEKEIRDELPDDMKEMNLNSSAQLGDLLFNKLKLPMISVTKTGAPSTGKSTLLRLASYSKLPEKILRYKKYEKSLNGFLIPWKEYLKRDNRLHTTYKIAQTTTGRLSAENPNLQQVPKDKAVRGLISAPKGYSFIEADYSQIELRIASFIAGEPTMKDTYKHGGDIHTLTASQVARVPIEKVTKEQRTGAKPVNFGFLYGMGWKSFKDYAFDTYGVIFDDTQSKDARKAYFNTYPQLLNWHERQRREAAQYGYIRTGTGRIRHLPNIYSPDNEVRGSAERQAINTPVQSLASDITLLAMILIDHKLSEKYGDKNACIVGQVHDAILVQAKDDISEEVGLLVKRCMEYIPVILRKRFGIDLDVPIVAEVTLGDAWGSGKPLEIPTIEKIA